jgi:hypothetical protein
VIHPNTDPARAPGTEAVARPAVAARRGDRSLAYGVAGAVAGAAILFMLAGPLSVDTGLLIVGAAVGWGVGLAVRTGAALARGGAGSAGRRIALAITFALASCVVAWVGAWAWSHVQGGVLGPLDFLAQVYGLLVPAQLAFTAAGAAIGSR